VTRKPRSARLEAYAKKRDFAKTPEPGVVSPRKRGASGEPRFVIQLHRATRLHYDFRLEADGVLKSWAVPRGPSLDPHDKRLAMAVEDHPLDYREFEGIIPAGNYGAGEVIVWDRGTYRLLEGTDVGDELAKGALKFELRGEKLRGAFALVHIKGRGGEENAWLLIKERDDAVDPSWRAEDHPASVATGKTLADLAGDPSAPHWPSRPVERRRSSLARAAARRAEPLPTIAGPMLATAIDAPFDDPAWLFELKWDGYRALATVGADGTARVVSRNGLEFTHKLPELASLAAAFSERPVIVDGELCVLDDEGKSSFGALQERLDRFGRAGGKSAVTFVVFDLLYGHGRDLRDESLDVRRAALEAILTGTGPVMFSKAVVGTGLRLFAFARERGLEGIVGKRRASPYRSARTRDWVKIKVRRRQEVVIGGWTEARGSRAHFGALLAGVYEEGELVSVGSVGTGFDTRTLAAVAKKLEPLAQTTSPFANPPKTDAPAHWVTPTLVAEVTFTEWTRDGALRHPVFVALRDDKAATDVTRERT
jgi:bifunctional non-homologous end joining protein LigD